MLKKELIREISKNTGLTQKLVKAVLEDYHETVMDTVSNGEDVKIVGFGTYTRRMITAKTIKLKGVEIHAEEKLKPKFVSSKDFTERVVEGGKR